MPTARVASRAATRSRAISSSRSSRSTTLERDDYVRDFDLSRNPVQADFIYGRDKFSMYVGGVGAGKTFAGALRSVLAATCMPGSVGLIYAPTYQMLEDATQKEFFALLPPALIAHFNAQKQHLWLHNGSEVLFRSADNPERFRGFQVAWFWSDEAPYCGHYAWELAKARLRQPGYPGNAWATGTPRGKDGFWRDFESAQRLRRHRLYRASTLANAHNLPQDYVESTLSSYTGDFYKQEVLGLFTAFEGLVYDAFDGDEQSPRTHVRIHPAMRRLADGERWARSPFARVVGGIDFGWRNPCVLLPVGIDSDDRAWVLDEMYRTKIEIVSADARVETVCTRVVEMSRRYDVDVWYADPENPEAIYHVRRALQRAGLRTHVLEAKKDIIPGIRTVSQCLARRADRTRGLYVHPRCLETLREFGEYQYPTKAIANRSPDEKPLKQHDHAMDALRYALFNHFSSQNKGRTTLEHVEQRLALRAEREREQQQRLLTSGVVDDDDWY